MRLSALLISAVFLVQLGRAFLPYEMPESKNLLPPSVSNLPTEDSGAWLDAMLTNNLWDKARGKLVVGNDSKSNNADGGNTFGQEDSITSWQLLGVSNFGKEQFALIRNGDNVKKVKVGQQLPDGSTLNEMLPFGIKINRLGKDESFYLFGKK